MTGVFDIPHSVREVTDHIRDLFDSDQLLSDLWISGEVLQSSTSRGGHVFFTLGGDGAKLQCVLFRMNALRQRVLPSPGAACIVHGRIEIYPTEGSYQLYADLIEEAGIGLAALEFELLRQQLESEGLFSESRKRQLPENPKFVGVVTSESGAVWHDIQNVIRRRYPFVQLLLSPAAVQGDTAPSTLTRALEALILDGRAEVVIIARGGGSVSDLAAFNDEALVRSVFSSPIPVVSAVGHETDWTLLDLVADLRAPTPSAAAELVTPSVTSKLNALTDLLLVHTTRFEREIDIHMLDLDQLVSRLERIGPATQVRNAHTRLEETVRNLQANATSVMWQRRVSIGSIRARMSSSVHSSFTQKIDRADHIRDLLQALSPTRTMYRGYAFVEHAESGKPLSGAADTFSGERIRTRFLDGSIDSIVTDIIVVNTQDPSR